MENAGAGSARLALGLLAGRPSCVVVLAGPGNNGGDAFVVARHLALEGVDVRIYVLPGRSGGLPGGDAGIQLGIVRAMGLPVLVLSVQQAVEGLTAELSDASLVVDGLFGTGLSSALEGVALAAVEAVNACSAPVLALDLPSGMDCDTGHALGTCVHATVTATFAAPKLGFSAPEAAPWVGDLVVVGIGAPVTWPLPDSVV